MCRGKGSEGSRLASSGAKGLREEGRGGWSSRGQLKEEHMGVGA